MRTIAMNLRERGVRIAALPIESGVVATRLNGWKSLIDIGDSVRRIYAVVEKTALEHTGLLWSWNETAIPY